MIQIVRFPGVVVKHFYYIFYEWVEKPFEGFKFPSNIHGELDFNKMTPEMLVDYEKCESDEYEVLYQGLQRDLESIRQPAVGRCWCGVEVVLQGAINQCKCGRCYNSSGQEKETSNGISTDS